MPKRNSWDDGWSGDGKSYITIRYGYFTSKIPEEGFYIYHFGDGWVAEVQVIHETILRYCNIYDRKHVRDLSDIGYFWMVTSIEKFGYITQDKNGEHDPATSYKLTEAEREVWLSDKPKEFDLEKLPIYDTSAEEDQPLWGSYSRVHADLNSLTEIVSMDLDNGTTTIRITDSETGEEGTLTIPSEMLSPENIED